MSEEALIEVVKQMQVGDEIIQYIKGEKELLSYFDQMMLQTSIAVRALENTLSVESIKKNIQLQAKLMGVIECGCILLCDTYKERLQFVLDKKADREKRR
jgi:chromosome condensin MukBEF complex kleisin-like MukF subunit